MDIAEIIAYIVFVIMGSVWDNVIMVLSGIKNINKRRE